MTASFSLRTLLSRSAILLVVLAGLVSIRPAHAQLGMDNIPSTRYLTAFGPLYDGDYRDALGVFIDEGGGAVKSGQTKWIDSICYYTMAGECYYQMGMLPQALDQYTRALQLYVSFSDWMIRCEFPPGIPMAGAGARPMLPWGGSQRGAKIGQFRDAYPMGQGRVNNNDVAQRGGVVQRAIKIQVNAVEIVRATTLAIRRRRELLGPTCKQDPTTLAVMNALSQRPGPPNHWSQAWVEVQLGCAHAALGNYGQASSILEHSILAAGEFDHPLTSTSLLELGKIALEAGDFNTASRLFEEATYSAATFLNLGVLEEAFRFGQMTHLLSGVKGPYPPLMPAAAWARQKGYRQLQVSLSTLAAENLAVVGNTSAAMSMLAEARSTMGRRDMANGAIGARTNFVNATLLFQSGNLAGGDQALGAVWKYQQTGSLWLFHIGLVDNAVTTRSIDSDRIALQLYETVLRDPTPADWGSSPMESLTVLTTPHPLPFEHWFETAINRTQDREMAMEIADRARRHRFYSTLPLGGRLLTLRWLLEGPEEMLDKQGLLERQELLAKYPNFDKLSLQAKKLHDELGKLSPVPDDDDQKKRQAGLFAELGKIGTAQELILREIAVRREAADMIFPPMRRTKDIQRSLPSGRLMLSFFNTSRGMYAFLFSREKYAAWVINSPSAVKRQLQLVLRDFGNFEQNHPLTQNEITSTDWKKNAIKLRELLFDKSTVDLNAKFDELVIIPDGEWWYLPWEALPVGPDNEPLISRTKIRYAPTMGLAVPYNSRPFAGRNIGVVVGKLYPQDKPEIAQAAFDAFHRSVPDSLAITEASQTPSALYRRSFDELVVLDDIEPGSSGPYDWSPAQFDRSKSVGALAAWFSLPWANGPDQLLLPGFHTTAENGLKGKRGVADGNDLFLPICGLMSSGVRTLLISRWRTGGQTSFDLVREFAQEMTHTPAAEAWQRSVLLAQGNALEPELEPRVKKFSAVGEPPKAEHPFFWSGYMLVDMGAPEERMPPSAPIAAPPPKAEPKEVDLKPAAPAVMKPLPNVGEVGNAKADDDDDNTKPKKPKEAAAGDGNSPITSDPPSDDNTRPNGKKLSPKKKPAGKR